MIRQFFALLPLALLVLPTISADTFVMKDGTKLQGELLRETDDHYIARIAVKPTIFEEKQLLKDDVSEIIPEAPDQEAFDQLGKLALPGDLAEISDYEAKKAAVTAFLKRYPDSTHKPVLDQYLAQLKEEQAKLAAGELKLDGFWLKPEEIKKRQYQIDAQQLLKQLRSDYRRGYPVSCLRDFHLKFPTFAYSELAPKFKTIAQLSLARYKSYLEKEITASKKRVEEREADLANSPLAERERLRDLFIKAEMKLEKQAEEDAANGQIWFNISPYDTEGLEEALELVEREQRSLEQATRPSEMTAEAGFAAFWAAIDKEDTAEAREIFGKMRSLRLDDAYITPLETAIDELKLELQARAERAKAAEQAAEEAKQAEPEQEEEAENPDPAPNQEPDQEQPKVEADEAEEPAQMEP